MKLTGGRCGIRCSLKSANTPVSRALHGYLKLAPIWERGSVSVQPKPVLDETEGALAPVARAELTVMANPLTAAQLSLTGRMLVRTKAPPAWEKTSSTHQNLPLGGHAQRAGEVPESAEDPLMYAGGVSSCAKTHSFVSLKNPRRPAMDSSAKYYPFLDRLLPNCADCLIDSLKCAHCIHGGPCGHEESTVQLAQHTQMATIAEQDALLRWKS